MKCQHPVTIYKDGKAIKVPCGRCVFCCNARAKDWELRLKHHFNSRDYFSFFITLTYEDDNLSMCPLPVAQYELTQKRPFKNTEKYCKTLVPHTAISSDEDYVPSLNPKDLQNFLKRLRINLSRYYGKTKISYFGIGEYGPTTFRPHYHIIIGINRSDFYAGPCKLQVSNSATRKKTILYTPEQIVSYLVGKSWNTQEGFTKCDPVTDTRIAYVSRYTFKFPSKGLSRYFKELPGLLRPFARCSKGIGESFVKANQHSLPGKTVIKQGSYSFRTPRYYRRKLLEDYLDADQSLAMIERYTQNEDDELKELERYYNLYCTTFHLPNTGNLADDNFQDWLSSSRLEKQRQIINTFTKRKKI